MSWVVRLVLLVLGVLVLLWVALLVIARRLRVSPRELAPLLLSTPGALRRLRKDERVPRRVRVALLLALIWVLSPIDLVPEFLPVIGPLDDLVVVALVVWYAARHVPRPALVEAWPEEHRPLVGRILGP